MRREAVWYESDNPNGFRTGRRFSVDEPALTVMAEGMGGDSLGHWRLVRGECPVIATAAPGQPKPAYRVPLMSEIAGIPWNGLTVASTFAGCGGSCLGYRMAGYRVLWASEFVPIACESYRANFPDTALDTRDIRTVAAGEVLAAAGLARGELDVLDGSPPCQPFSTAGKREKSWGKVREYGDHRQRADDLFFEYVRLVDGLRPRAFVAENVSGLVKGTAKGHFKRILAALKACGYAVQARLLDAQWLGVPQARQRIIFVGVRDDLGLPPAFPEPLPYRYSVRDALPWIGSAVGHFKWSAPESTLDPDRPFPTVAASGAVQQRPEVTSARAVNDRGHAGMRRIEPEAMLGGYAVGREWDRLRPGGQSGRYFQLVRPLADSPSPTVTKEGGNASLAGVTHPFERRKFTIAELRRICGFPDDFVLCGSYAEQWARLGNAVPPVMMRHVAAAVRDGVLDRAPRPDGQGDGGRGGAGIAHDVAPPDPQREPSHAD